MMVTMIIKDDYGDHYYNDYDIITDDMDNATTEKTTHYLRLCL